MIITQNNGAGFSSWKMSQIINCSKDPTQLWQLDINKSVTILEYCRVFEGVRLWYVTRLDICLFCYDLYLLKLHTLRSVYELI